MKPSFTFFRLIAVMLVLALAGSGCSFNRAWKAAATSPAPNDDIQGRWQGTWVSEVNAHTGKLRCLVTRMDDGKYQAWYQAKYKTVLSFSYKAKLDATFRDGAWKFTGDADLGRLAGGIYRYDGQANGTNFYSTYRSQYDHGLFEMKRPE